MKCTLTFGEICQHQTTGWLVHNGAAVGLLKEHRMATNVKTNAEAIAHQFAGAIRDEPAVEQLWLVEDSDSVQLIAITSDVDAETERRIFEVFGELITQYPTAGLFPRVLNPRFFIEGTEMVSLLPRRARQIPLCN